MWIRCSASRGCDLRNKPRYSDRFGHVSKGKLVYASVWAVLFEANRRMQLCLVLSRRTGGTQMGEPCFSQEMGPCFWRKLVYADPPNRHIQLDEMCDKPWRMPPETSLSQDARKIRQSPTARWPQGLPKIRPRPLKARPKKHPRSAQDLEPQGPEPLARRY